MDRLKVSGKPFDISKREVWEAYEKVKANKGAPGVDGCSIVNSQGWSLWIMLPGASRGWWTGRRGWRRWVGVRGCGR